MQHSKPDTIILLFSREPELEGLHKSLSHNRDGKDRKRLFERLHQKSLRLCKKSGLPFIWFHSGLQKGDDFAQRFTHAFSTLFNLGYERIIAIGSDVPTIQISELKQAAIQLKSSNAVIGPAVDGGAWLIGLNREAFIANAFCGLDWESSNLRNGLIDSLRSNNNSITVLDYHRDLDCDTDVVHMLRQNISRELRKCLQRLNQSLEPLRKQDLFYRFFFVPQKILGRPPPS